jgi:hypothetical protein
MKKKTLTEFIENAKSVHGNKYDYSLVDYINNATKIKIICLEHGEFEQMPVKHLSGQSCPTCSSKFVHDTQRKNILTFINESKSIHGDKYDYSLVDYVNSKTKIKIICPIHGEFEQIPSNHLRGKGCLYCGGTSGMDNNSFILKSKNIHADKYDYSKTNYINSHTKVTITCPEHGDFKQLPNNHISKNQGCYRCLGKIHDNYSFIEHCSLIHSNKYDYSLVEYDGITSEVEIICPIHGLFKQRCDSHKNGVGCYRCYNNGVSIIEKEVVDFITSLNINYFENDRKILNNKELDIYIPSHNLAIEYNGIYWHSELYKDKNYHLNKTIECEKQGIQLIHIFEDEWLYKQDIVKSRLMNLLGLTPNKIYGRKTIIREVSPKDSKVFLDKNHIQGNVNSSIKLGLYYNDELVSLITFGKGRIMMGNGTNQYELLRFCNKLNTSVIGGADKLFKYFIKTYNPIEIISYADRRWSQGDLYEKLGFTFVHDSKPNYFYIVNKKREYRFKYRKDVLVKEGYDQSKSEKQIMLDRGIYRIYDSGNKKYIFKV